jgi:hypothetical protein
MSADDGWDTTELGRQGGEAYDVRFDRATGTVTVTGAGGEPESFEVDAGGDWRGQAARELAARGYGARWTRWDDTDDGAVLSVARTSAEAPADDDWERGAASYSAAAAEAPEPPPRPAPRELGRVRVYPTYTFPVYQSGPGGIGLDQTITITDWDKQGRQWAEAEARRQVTEALGEPSDDAVGGAWWMGRGSKDAFRWQPEKGTPRSAKPFDGMPEPPPWEPERPEPAAETAAETGPEVAETVAETGPAGGETEPAVPGSSAWYAEQEAKGRTPAEIEESLPPDVQAQRYADRKDHHETWRGTGKRARNGYPAHRKGCRVCQDIDAGGDGVGRRMHVVAPAPAAPPVVFVAPAEAPAPAPSSPRGEAGPVRFTFAGDEATEVRHWRWEGALDALQDQVGGWEIPPDGSGVLDTDSFIASIGGYVQGLAGVLGQLGEQFGSGETPIAPVVGETLADFAAALGVMSAEAAEVHQRWTENDDNAHDLRRARGEIPGAHLFNVTPAA